MDMSAIVYIWAAEDNLELVPCHDVYCRDQTWVRLDGKYPYPLSHPASPRVRAFCWFVTGSQVTSAAILSSKRRPTVPDLTTELPCLWSKAVCVMPKAVLQAGARLLVSTE